MVLRVVVVMRLVVVVLVEVVRVLEVVGLWCSLKEKNVPSVFNTQDLRHGFCYPNFPAGK